MEGITQMARKKNPTPGEAIAKSIIETYDPKTTDDIQDALKSIFGPIFESMLDGEIEHHLGYASNERTEKSTTNRRNGYGKKTLKTSMGDIDIKTPRDREATFEPQAIPKRTTDVSSIEGKVLSMYAKGLSQRDIADIIEDIYGFSISHQQISIITDSVLEELARWQSRSLKKFYPFIFVDCLYVNIRTEYETKNHAIYTILAYDLAGKKDILGLWIAESENKSQWMQIFDELKVRGVEDIGFISMDGLPGLEDGAATIYPKAVIQRCIVHMIRNSIKYIPQVKYKAFTAHLKLIYKAPNKKVALLEFEKFKEQWSHYPGAIRVWDSNWKHVEQLYNYTEAIRKVMYTTNAIESVNSSFRKVTNKGTFPNENAVLKVLYLRILELYEKWSRRSCSNWADILNQMIMIEGLSDRVLYYQQFE
jgi:transposase-like protein